MLGWVLAGFRKPAKDLPMSSEIAISVQNVSKCYHLYDTPHDRLKQFLLPTLQRWVGQNPESYCREFWSLRDISFDVRRGETLGVIGKNGAGKSTLLQILCGTLFPSTGEVRAKGRIAALLELGAGFNTEFTGRENIYMNASILGLSRAEIEAKLDEIIAFADIGIFIDQPVKTYSSGMFVRLAFSIATSVEPDILIIDEALSVGDGAFARKSFDRIMKIRDAGKTVLFCSHSLYQIEAICDRAIWLKDGNLAAIDIPSKTVMAYNSYLSQSSPVKRTTTSPLELVQAVAGSARISRIVVSSDGIEGTDLCVISKRSCVEMRISFVVDVQLPPPSVAVVLTDLEGRNVASSGTCNDSLVLQVSPDGCGSVSLIYDKIPLLKGEYWVNIFLMCERGVYTYEEAPMIAKLVVDQLDLEIGVVSLPHTWRVEIGK